MFILIIIFLRFSGKRGVRQLSVFELAIILSLGSAAGDPMFNDDIPIIQALIVICSHYSSL
jgi:Predicted membrane protein